MKLIFATNKTENHYLILEFRAQMPCQPEKHLGPAKQGQRPAGPASFSPPAGEHTGDAWQPPSPQAPTGRAAPASKEHLPAQLSHSEPSWCPQLSCPAALVLPPNLEPCSLPPPSTQQRQASACANEGKYPPRALPPIHLPPRPPNLGICSKGGLMVVLAVQPCVAVHHETAHRSRAALPPKNGLDTMDHTVVG